MTRLAMHIGAHKTGTSLLQKYMRDNETAVNRAGIRYIGRGDMNGYVGWGSPLLETPEKFRGRLDEEAKANPGTVIVASHENTLGRPMIVGKADLYPEAEPRIEALARLVSGIDTTIIYYIRRQSSFVESYYLQLVHQGSFETFDSWFSSFDPKALSWRPTLDCLEKAFGQDNVIVVDFDEIKGGQNQFIEKFMRRVTPNFDAAVNYKPSRNRSISGKGLKIALAANPHLRTGEERSNMRKFLQKHYSNVDYPRPVLLSEEQKGSLQTEYQAEFENL